MALAAGPLTPLKDRGEGADGEGGSGDDQQDKGQTWEGTEPLGGTAAGCPSPQHWFLHTYVQYHMLLQVRSVSILLCRWMASVHHTKLVDYALTTFILLSVGASNVNLGVVPCTVTLSRTPS